MAAEKSAPALPRDVPNYHERQAGHLRALAATATTRRVKDRLFREAQEHEDMAALVEELEKAD